MYGRDGLEKEGRERLYYTHRCHCNWKEENYAERERIIMSTQNVFLLIVLGPLTVLCVRDPQDVLVLLQVVSDFIEDRPIGCKR